MYTHTHDTQERRTQHTQPRAPVHNQKELALLSEQAPPSVTNVARGELAPQQGDRDLRGSSTCSGPPDRQVVGDLSLSN